MRRASVRLAALLGLGVIAGRGAAAQRFTAEVSSQSVEAGEAVTYALSLEGTSALSNPAIALPEGAYMAGGPNISNMHRFDGVSAVSSQEFKYTLGFNKPGTYEIGPATVKTRSRRTLRSNTVRVVVRQAGSAQDVRVFARVSPARAYVGQPVVAVFEFAVARQIKGYELSVPFLREGKGIRLFDPEGLGEKWQEAYQRTRQGLPGHDVLEISDPKVSAVAKVSRRDIEGVPYTVYSVKRVLLPQEVGRVDFGETRAAANVVVGYGRARDPFFDDPFFGPSLFARRQAVTRTVVASSEAMALEVIEPPEAGRPDGYEGAIGRYEVAASAHPGETTLGGDPVQLTLRVRGEGNLETVGVPRLAEEGGFRVGVPEQSQEMRFDGDRLVGEKRFVVPLRPRSVNVTEIPECRLPVFDPSAGRYVVLTTAPIRVTVSPPEGTGAIETIALPAEAASRPAQAPVRLDIEDIETERDPTESHAAWIHRPAGIVALFVLPAAVYAALAAYAARMRRLREDSTLARRLSALSSARARLEQIRREGSVGEPAEYAGRLSRILQTYVADISGRPTGELPAGEAEELLGGKGVGGDAAREVVSILQAAEAARFGGAELDRDVWLERVSSSIESVAREVKP